MIAIILASAEDDGEEFREMFPDSYTGKGYYLGKTKIKYITKYKIAPYIKDVFKNNFIDI